ncbi:DUF317 domain-containing protein [Kitasatospora purpeofusca]|uniref:DUF317 domain-containing protein n=1 Tax=Kitasatospora purpeofusca TaxID=67352 RepID=UPI0035DDA785
MAFDHGTHDMPMTVLPGYLAGPGDSTAALADFLDGRPEWNLEHPSPRSTVAIHEDETVLIVLDARRAARHRWSISSYLSPDGPLDWTATLSPQAPAEVATALARRLGYVLAQPTVEQRHLQLWGGDGAADCDRRLHTEAALAGWSSSGDTGSTVTHERPDGTAGLVVRGFHGHPSSPGTDRVFTLWAGPGGRQTPSWTAQFTRFTPTAILVAALHTLTRPAPYLRRASQIPMAHRSYLSTHPLSRPRPEHLAGAAQDDFAEPLLAVRQPQNVLVAGRTLPPVRIRRTDRAGTSTIRSPQSTTAPAEPAETAATAPAPKPTAETAARRTR